MNLTERARAGVVRVDPSDVPDLAPFQADHFGIGSRQVDPALTAWRFGPRSADRAGAPLFWVCRRDGQLVGQQGALPARVQVAGRTVEACWAIDLIVHPDWRLRGIAPALSQALLESVPLCLGLSVSEQARRALCRAGWLDLGCVPRLARLIRPLSDGQAPLGSSWVATSSVAALSGIAAPLLAAHDRVMLPRARAGTTLEPLRAIDPRMEDVWRRSASLYGAVVRRDPPALRWRFDEAPHAEAYDRWLLSRRGEPLAWAVTRRRGSGLVVVDYFGPPDDLRPLFAHVVEAARTRGASLVTCLAAPPQVRRALRRLGFVERPGPRLMAFLGPDAELPADVLRDREAWFLTDADSDLDHVKSPADDVFNPTRVRRKPSHDDAPASPAPGFRLERPGRVRTEVR